MWRRWRLVRSQGPSRSHHTRCEANPHTWTWTCWRERPVSVWGGVVMKERPLPWEPMTNWEEPASTAWLASDRQLALGSSAHRCTTTRRAPRRTAVHAACSGKSRPSPRESFRRFFMPCHASATYFEADACNAGLARTRSSKIKARTRGTGACPNCPPPPYRSPVSGRGLLFCTTQNHGHNMGTSGKMTKISRLDRRVRQSLSPRALPSAHHHHRRRRRRPHRRPPPPPRAPLPCRTQCSCAHLAH